MLQTSVYVRACVCVHVLCSTVKVVTGFMKFRLLVERNCQDKKEEEEEEEEGEEERKEQTERDYMI